MRYPYKNPAGNLVWACCESSIGPPCGHSALPFNAALDAAQAEVEAEEADDLLEAVCPTCSAENLPMGIAGRTVHYRCRACGMGYSHTLTEAAWENYASGWEAE